MLLLSGELRFGGISGFFGVDGSDGRTGSASALRSGTERPFAVTNCAQLWPVRLSVDDGSQLKSENATSSQMHAIWFCPYALVIHAVLATSLCSPTGNRTQLPVPCVSHTKALPFPDPESKNRSLGSTVKFEKKDGEVKFGAE